MISSQIASLIHCTSRAAGNILGLFRRTNNIIEGEGRPRTLLNN